MLSVPILRCVLDLALPSVLALSGLSQPAPPAGAGELPPAYAALLAGEISAPADEDWGARLAANLDREDWAWEYALTDLDGDGAPELFLRLADTPAISRIFHEAEGAVQCWYWQDHEMNYVVEPLTDGKILVMYDYGGVLSHSVYTMDETGRGEQPLESWAHRYSSEPLGTPLSWSYNGREVDAQTYTDLFIQNLQPRRTVVWSPISSCD